MQFFLLIHNILSSTITNNLTSNIPSHYCTLCNTTHEWNRLLILPKPEFKDITWQLEQKYFCAYENHVNNLFSLIETKKHTKSEFDIEINITYTFTYGKYYMYQL